MILQGAITFTAMVALDFVWARYTTAIVAKRPAMAGLWASGILLFNSTVILSYTSEPWMIVPAVAGAFVGTYWAVRTAR